MREEETTMVITSVETNDGFEVFGGDFVIRNIRIFCRDTQGGELEFVRPIEDVHTYRVGQKINVKYDFKI